jgi:hypothetical protein
LKKNIARLESRVQYNQVLHSDFSVFLFPFWLGTSSKIHGRIAQDSDIHARQLIPLNLPHVFGCWQPIIGEDVFSFK